MVAYLDSTQCRSVSISSYFGETHAAPCGVCDFCLEQKQKPIQVSEFESISKEITTKLKEQSRTTEELLAGIGRLRQEKFWEVLNFLQSEKIIESDADGKVRLRV
jgi:ATP-dependent DNA helicase RecQ